ncbi:MAG: hypothetical protein O7F08_07285 [Deltaproteobacteria bacterium]|nr:hypothetical protein [Deltaproteobacteria bacterium]
MSRVMLSCLAVLLVVGCRSRAESPRGAFHAPKPAFETAAPTNVRPIIDTPDPAIIDTPVIVQKKPRKKPAKRDLAAELQRAVGSPIDCMRDFESSAPTKLQIPISATVRPTGMVIQPTVGGVGLSANARRCIEQRMTFVKLRPLKKPLSQTVSTFVEVDYTPPVIVESDTASDPELKNVEEPLPKRPEVPPSGRPIQPPTSKPIMDAKSKGPDGPSGRPVRGPKPRPIDGYEVDENAQQWL